MNCWILQSNPEYFRILDWLRDFKPEWKSGELDCYHINFFVDEVENDDRVYIWKSKGNDSDAGIYAEGVVKPKPDRFSLEDKEESYWKNKAKMKEMELKKRKIAVRYVNFFDKPLLKKELEGKPELRGLTILRNARHGIYMVTPEQCRIIESLLTQNR